LGSTVVPWSQLSDGAALYSPQAIWTTAYEKLSVTFVVINNREYSVLKNFMRSQESYASVRANQFIAMDLVNPPIDFLALGKSMGIPAERLNKVGDIAPAIEGVIASGRPSIRLRQYFRHNSVIQIRTRPRPGYRTGRLQVDVKVSDVCMASRATGWHLALPSAA
jgi:thiamine pyrophosphate-dependent acetolactate synthase large subunit-like protein